MTNQVTEKNIADYIDFVHADWIDWCERAEINSSQKDDMNWIAKEGRNYIKIIQCRGDKESSVHSFIVKKATKKFVEGDVLMAAGWNAPATNFARATVFDTETFKGRIRWAGIC